MLGIQVSARVDRENGIYLTGETVNVGVALKSNIIQPKRIAWGCVQLHCDQVDFKLKPDEKAMVDSATALSHTKTALYSSSPKIIFCDITVNGNEPAEYKVSFLIPQKMPPSFKGAFIKYAWYLTIAVQCVDAPFKMMTFPLKVISLDIPVNLPNTVNENPFLVSNVRQPPVLEFALNSIEDAASLGRSNRCYKINNGTDVFATVTFARDVFKLGEGIGCHMKFETNAKCYCSAVTVSLQTVETYIQTQHSNVQTAVVRNIVTMFMNEVNCQLLIPANATPGFTTDLAKVAWRLHFEFLVHNKSPVNINVGNNSISRDLDCEKVEWDYYVQVHACSPFNANLASTQTVFSIVEDL